MSERRDRAKAVFQAAVKQDTAGRQALPEGFPSLPASPQLLETVSSRLPASPAVAPGTRLGPYELQALIGAGGMGQVYRARDTRLGRQVAVKVLPPGLAPDPERVRRFGLEACAASALNHPNILVVFDVGTHEGTPYLVTELLEGSSLADVIRSVRLSTARAVEYGLQIARGLAAAHDKGIVHRDLKPGNVFVTRSEDVKILDFGLARLTRPGETGETAHGRGMPPLTSEGVVLGTVGYMAPEQVRGEPADARSDVFSFGAVLYEMLAGRRAFARDTAAETMAAVLQDDPEPLVERRPEVSAAVARFVGRCLAKRAEDRFSSGREALFALEVAAAVTGAPLAAARAPERPRGLIPWSWLAPAALGAVLAATGLIALPRPRASPAGRGPVVSSLVLPSQIGSLLRWNGAPDVALSPDGSRLAYVGVGSDRRPALWIRELAKTAVRELPGTANAIGPFWSPDGRFLAFIADDKLRTVAESGGPVHTLCDAGEPVHGMGGGSWSRDGVILFSRGTDLARVSASGGAPSIVRSAGPGELHLRFPSFLPDGRRFLFFVRHEKGPDRIYAASLDGGEPAALLQSQSRGVYSPTGHLLFVRDGILLAQAIDEPTLRPRGEPQPVATGVASLMSNGRAAFSVSDGGALTYVEASANVTELVWKDREGRLVDTLAEQGRYLAPALAPDGRRVVVEAEDPESSQHVLWILGPARGVRSRLPRLPYDGHHPHWSPDGTQIAFSSTRAGKWLSYRRRTDGLGEDVLIYDNPDVVTFYTRQWTADGNAVLLSGVERDGRSRLWLAPADGRGQARPLVDGHQGALSPDRRWLAVAAKPAGRYEIYVLPFPALDTRWQVSTNGGNWPRWRADGRELFYASEDRKLMAVPIAAGTRFEAGPPRALFPLSLRPTDDSPVWPPDYDVSRDGQRFLLCQTPENVPPPSVTLLTGWTGLLRR